MKIKMKTLASGPDGVLSKGEIVDLPKEQAEALIAGGFAQSASPSALVTSMVEENTTFGPEETASTGKSGKGKPAKEKSMLEKKPGDFKKAEK